MEFGFGPTGERICGIIVKTVVGLFVLLGFFGMIRAFLGPPVILIHNASPHNLINVKAIGNGFSKSMPDLKPNERYYFIGIPDGESGIALEFTANGTTRRSGDDGYFESGGGHCVMATIDVGMSVNVKASGPLCFSWRRIVYPSDRALFGPSPVYR
jgi:hypothetical protein